MSITEPIEYVYIVSKGTSYEAYQSLKEDSIYTPKESYDSNKKGTMYEDLSYDEAMYYKAAILANTQGRIVGDTSGKEFSITVPNKTGSWSLGYYVDDFGQKTATKFLMLKGKGMFSNSATPGSDLTAILIVDANGAKFRLFEYGNNPVQDDDSCTMYVKGSDGSTYSWYMYSGESGYITFGYSSANDLKELKALLSKGGKIYFTTNIGEYSSSHYAFILDGTGYQNALKYLK